MQGQRCGVYFLPPHFWLSFLEIKVVVAQEVQLAP
jgi:hypothetical protein